MLLEDTGMHADIEVDIAKVMHRFDEIDLGRRLCLDREGGSPEQCHHPQSCADTECAASSYWCQYVQHCCNLPSFVCDTGQRRHHAF
jgi:hypothetical protein